MESSGRTLLTSVAIIVALGAGFAAAKLMDHHAPPAKQADEKEKPQGGLDTLAMDDARLAANGIEVETVSTGGLASEIVAQANVEAAPGAQAVLTARVAGSVARITKRIGDPVGVGEVLALVESREAAQIAATRTTAAAKADLARKIFERERWLYEEQVSPRQDLETAQAELVAADAEARSATSAVGAAKVSRDGRYVMVLSPIAGRVTAASASLGAFVQPETELFRVTDPRQLQIEASVTAPEARRIHPGDAAALQTNEGATASAVVRSITPAVDPTTRAATVVLALTSGQGLLQPGQLVRARIATRQGATAGIVVPEDAIQSWEGHDVVFVRTKAGFAAQPVTVSTRSGGRAEITAGLRAGEVVAVRNAFRLKAELGKGEADED
jgi:cobalt-zinc-cadmium efflux system membrane fusion protein